MPLTPYRVSTITAVGDVRSAVDLGELFDRITLKCDAEADASDASDALDASDASDALDASDRFVVVRAELDDRERGEPASWRCRRRRAAAEAAGRGKDGNGGKKRFANQATLVLADRRLGDAGGRINMKVFRNGRVQVTGVRYIDQGREVMDHLASKLRDDPGMAGVAADASGVRAEAYRVCLINSDFDLGFPIKRAQLHSCMRERFPLALVSYEPCTYPGLKIKYMWNAADAAAPAAACDAACACGLPRTCDGRGDGGGPGACRKVTVSIFQSGKVIITGANTSQQLDDVYRFVVERVALPNRAAIELPPPPMPPMSPKAK